MENEYSISDELEVRIERIVPGGHGIAFAEGLTVFVSLAVPGDLVRVMLTKVKGKIAFAEIVEVLERSVDRIDPPCLYFGTCGGCDFQQMNYAAQLTAKVDIIRDCLRRIAKFEYEPEIPIIPSMEEFGYRLRAQWHANASVEQIGYYKRDSRDLVDIKECMVLVPELNEQLDSFRRELSWKTLGSGKLQIDAAVGSDGTISMHSDDLADPADEIEVASFGEKFRFTAKSFFQGNRSMIDWLVETAIRDAKGETALDLYCGVGLFTLPLARRFAKVVGVEGSEESIQFADINAKNAGFSNIDLYPVSVRQYLASEEAAKADFVLLDPPRAGTEKDTIMNLIRLAPTHVSYVACEPSVLARDLKRFVENGYSISSITALDMFPQTHHVETVVHFKQH